MAPDYAEAQQETTRVIMEQLVTWRRKLTVSTGEEPAEDEDRLFAAQIATRLLELSLRPFAVHDRDEIGQLVRPFSSGEFKTSLRLGDIISMLVATGAIHRGHFELLSGMHSDYFFMFSRLGTRVDYRKQLANELAERLRDLKIQTVIAPISAGGLLLQDVASALSAQLAFYDVDDHSRPIGVRRGYSVSGRTVILNDMTTTGRGIQQMIDTVEAYGAVPVGLALVATRGEIGAEIARQVAKIPLRVEALFHFAAEAVSREACLKCKLGLPFVRSADINR